MPFWLSVGEDRVTPRLTRALLTYRKHKASGQAITLSTGWISIRDPHGIKASKVEYDLLVRESL
jgi:hypothetical protein